MKLSIKAGSTSQSVNVFILDSASTTGEGKTGMVFNSAGLTAYYSHAGADATATAITLATLAAVNSAWSSGGFKEIDATNMPGWYRLDVPDAVLAASKGRSVAVHLKGAAGMVPLPIEIELTGFDNQSATVLLSSGTGTGQLDFTGGIVKVDLQTIKTQAVTCAAGVTVLASVGTAATSTAQTGDAFARIGVNGAGLTALGDTRLANLDVASSTLATAANLATLAGYVDTEVAAIKAKTDNLPAAPAATGDIPTAATIADAVWDEATSGHSTAGTTGKALTDAAASGDPWGTALPGAYSAGTAGHIIGNRIDVALSTLATAAALQTVDDFLDTEIAAIKAKTDNLPAAPAATGDIPTADQNADALLARNIAGGSSSGRTVTQALCFLRNKWTVAAGTLTVYGTDDSTTSWTATVSTDASALPVTGNDPA